MQFLRCWINLTPALWDILGFATKFMGYLFFLGLGGVGEDQSRGEDVEDKEEVIEGGVWCG